MTDNLFTQDEKLCKDLILIVARMYPFSPNWECIYCHGTSPHHKNWCVHKRSNEFLETLGERIDKHG